MDKESYSLEWMHSLAQEMGGKCMSNIFESPENKYAWKCGEGHIFVADCNEAKESWCPKCKEVPN